MRTPAAPRNKTIRMPPAAPKPSAPRNALAELLADIDGVPVLVRLVVADHPADSGAGVRPVACDLQSLLSNAVEKLVDRMGGSPLRDDGLAARPRATVELICSEQHIARLPAPSNDTLLRVGPLELDLLDRTARRAGRRIALRPREFQLLKYMMQRSGELLTRAALLQEVWNYKIVPETNLIDVHIGRLRRKIDGPGEPALIGNVRGLGFILSATAFPRRSAADYAGRAWQPRPALQPPEPTLQC